MYLGRTVESGTRAAIFDSPQHPYTKALLSATPMAEPGARRDRIVLEGELPSPFAPPPGCAFNPRCREVIARCRVERPPEAPVHGRSVACWVAQESAARDAA